MVFKLISIYIILYTSAHFWISISILDESNSNFESYDDNNECTIIDYNTPSGNSTSQVLHDFDSNIQSNQEKNGKNSAEYNQFTYFNFQHSNIFVFQYQFHTKQNQTLKVLRKPMINSALKIY